MPECPRRDRLAIQAADADSEIAPEDVFHGSGHGRGALDEEDDAGGIGGTGAGKRAARAPDAVKAETGGDAGKQAD
jgi:hypothetical protein